MCYVATAGLGKQCSVFLIVVVFVHSSLLCELFSPDAVPGEDALFLPSYSGFNRIFLLLGLFIHFFPLQFDILFKLCFPFCRVFFPQPDTLPIL